MTWETWRRHGTLRRAGRYVRVRVYERDVDSAQIRYRGYPSKRHVPFGKKPQLGELAEAPLADFSPDPVVGAPPG
jgi:hypothetical protein